MTEPTPAVRHYPAADRPTAPVCSICIANYNGVGLLADCLDSILAQDAPFTFEILVHDDASTDDSVAFLRARYPQVELLAGNENVGFCISNNRLGDHARGRFLLLLNNDAALQPGALAALHAHAIARPEAGILTLPQRDWLTGDLVDRGCLLDPFYNPVPNLDATRENVAMVIGACLWIERSLWHELGAFPDWLQSIGEDLYLCCLARLRGHQVHALAASGYRHRQGASFGGGRANVERLESTFRRRQLSERNKTYALMVFSPSASAWVLLAIHLPLLAAEGLVLSLIHRRMRIFREVYANAIKAVFRHRAFLSRRRRDIQAGKVVGFRTYFSAFTWLPRKLAMLWRYGVPDIR